MGPLIYQKVEKIYYQVLEQKPKDIEQFISDQANGDNEIITKVEELLAIDDYKTYNKTSDDILANLSEIITDQTDDFDSDKYKLIKKIGEGGMGTVYLATRLGDDIQQQVAIKLINSIYTTDANIERFKNERQILASLDHENIARFIDAGTTQSGILFVVMEYVEGISLKHYCRENHLTVKQKFTLFLQLCNAIDYAHQNFIIHRDIKPGNILVNKKGKLKLLDFGIAKLVDENAQQMIATVTKIMTPAYASPEQLLGKKVTVQSDIYALGIVLFEMIIGSRPYQQHEGDPHSFQVKVINGITTKPSEFVNASEKNQLATNKHSLKGDIDAILTKVINADCKHRYATVLELKQDIKAYLNGFPIKARKPNALYFFKLFILRNKLVASLSITSLAIIIAFSLYSFIQNEQLKTRGIELAEQRDEAILQAKKAKMASDFLLDSFQTADPTRTFGEKLTIKKVMESSYEKLKREPLEDKTLNAELYHTISKAFYGMGAYDLAFESADNGLKEVENMQRTDDLIKVKLLIEKAKGYFVKMDYSKTLTILNVAEKLCTNNTLVNDCFMDEIYLYISNIHNNVGDLALAKSVILKAISWLENNNIDGIRHFKSLLALANIERGLFNLKEANKILTRISSILSIDSPAESYYYIVASTRKIKILEIQKKYTLAIEKITNLLDIINQKFGKFNTLYTEALVLRAKLHTEMKEYQLAKPIYEEIIVTKKKLNLAYKADLNNLANLYYHFLKNYPKAIELYTEVISLDPINTKISSQRSAIYRRNLGMAYFRTNQFFLSLKYLKQAKSLHEALPFDNTSSITRLIEWIDHIQKNKLTTKKGDNKIDAKLRVKGEK